MFGGSSTANSSGSPGSKTDESAVQSDRKSPSPKASPQDIGSANTNSTPVATTTTADRTSDYAASGEKRSGNGSPPTRQETGGSTDKKRRSSSVSNKASSLLASAKNSLSFAQLSRTNSGGNSPIHKLGKQDPALAVPQGQHNNAAGESVPGPKSTFRVGVWEDRNKKCRRTMEDTHAFLYNFLSSNPGRAGSVGSAGGSPKSEKPPSDVSGTEMVETDNGYFAIFDGHAGTFAADWCGKKLHTILEDVIKRNPKVPLPELLDQTFTSVDAQLEKLPLKNSGCTAAIAVLRWENRPSNDRGAAPAPAIALPTASKSSIATDGQKPDATDEVAVETESSTELDGAAASISSKGSSSRQRVLYTANVGDARIILCRNGKALRLSYDHKGSDENEGKRISNAGGLILNNRVNGVLAVTRALGDAYMKDLVTGHPYTTETVIQSDLDEFIIIACDGLWDVCSDQEAVDLVRTVRDPTAASKQLVEHAISNLSTDNLSCMIVRLDKEATAQTQMAKEGAESESDSTAAGASEAEKIVLETKQKIAEGSAPARGVSATNGGRGYDTVVAAPQEEAVGEETVPASDLDGPEVTIPEQSAEEEAVAEEAVKRSSGQGKPVL